MTNNQLVRKLKAIGLTQTEAAKELGITTRSMRRYMNGDQKIPKFIELAVLYLGTLKPSMVDEYSGGFPMRPTIEDEAGETAVCTGKHDWGRTVDNRAVCNICGVLRD